MPIKIPTLSDIIASVRSDIRKLLPSSDPSVFGSMIRAFSDSNAGRHYDNVLLIKQLEKELFPDTASGEALERWAGYEGITRFPSAVSTGNATAQGTPGSIIPDATQFLSADGTIYISQGDSTISAVSLSILSITISGSTATATLASSSIIASGITATISGAVETEYNGAHTITALSDTQFSYEITGTPASPATGTILAAFNNASVSIVSQAPGLSKNLESGAIISLSGPISGVNNDSFVQASGLVGGAEEETDSSLLARTLQSRSNPVANYNIAAITKKALAVAGVTRVKVKRITPYVGAVTVLFVRDNDSNIIPDASEVAELKTSLLEILPANSAESDLFVTAPTAISTAFSFTAISPNTPSMKTAITANIEALFEDVATFETNLTEDQYRAAIIDTVDPDTGTKLVSFALATPAGDIVVSTDEIATLDTVNYA